MTMGKQIGKATRKLNRFTKPTPPPLSQEKDMWAPDWDNPNVQLERVLTREQTPRFIGRGPSGTYQENK